MTALTNHEIEFKQEMIGSWDTLNCDRFHRARIFGNVRRTILDSAQGNPARLLYLLQRLRREEWAQDPLKLLRANDASANEQVSK